VRARTASPALLAAALLALGGCGGSDDARSTAAGGDSTCEWLPDSDGQVIDVGTPPEDVPTSGTVQLTMALGQGDLGLSLDRESAPCAAASFVFLAEEGYFDDTICHREVNQPSFGVLQCGDPTGTGTGGPGYRFAQEVTNDTSYPRGTIAMANTGQPDSTGSQFFLCFVDTALTPDYTAVGMVDEDGLAVLDEIAEAGNDGSLDPSPGGGAPAVPVEISSVTVEG
jgi:peptidyl-prolyl cis-trans isomerase B (cyclophilin B)